MTTKAGEGGFNRGDDGSLDGSGSDSDSDGGVPLVATTSVN
jgi:hypothetical protein